MYTLPLELKLNTGSEFENATCCTPGIASRRCSSCSIEEQSLRRRRIAIALQAKLPSHESIGTPAVVEALEALQSAEKKSCAGEENHSECHFADDEAVTKTMV